MTRSLTVCVARLTGSHKAESQAQLQRHRNIRATLNKQRQVIDEHKAQIEQDWNTLVGPLAIDTELRTPAELCAWLRQRDQVVQLVDKVEEIRQSLEPVEHTYNTKLAAVSRILAEMGEPLSATNLDLADILDRSEVLIKRHDELTQKHTKLETKLATARSELTVAKLSLQTAMPSWPPGKPSGLR